MGIKGPLAVSAALLIFLFLNGFVLNGDFLPGLYIYSPDNELLTEDYDEIRKISQEQFGISYYAKSYGNINTEFRSISANIYGVNALYEPFNNIVLKEGSFITLSHEENNEKTAVLNLNAAYALLGTTENITGETIVYEGKTYIISGVADDNEKTEENIYIPITSLNKGIKEMIIPLDENITKEKIINTLENSGLSSGYITKKTEDYTDTPKYMAIFSFCCFLCLAGILLLVSVLICIFKDFRDIRTLSNQFYFKELILKNKSVFFENNF